MDVVILLVFISLCLVAASLFFFVHRLRAGDFEHGDRLALTPLDEEPGVEPSEEELQDAPTQPDPSPSDAHVIRTTGGR